MTNEQKTCVNCRRTLPVTSFYPRGSTGGRTTVTSCKECERARNRAKNQHRAARTSAEVLADRNRLRPDGVKRCSRCKVAQPFHDFGTKRTTADGLHDICRACEAGRDRDRAAESTALRNAHKSRTDAEVIAAMQAAHPEGSKTCGRCRTSRPIEEFSRARDRYDGLQTRCRWCSSATFKAVDADRWEDLDMFRCVYCGGPFEEVDHVLPVSRGGTDDPRNLVPACVECNRGAGGKFDRTPAEWRPEFADVEANLYVTGG